VHAQSDIGRRGGFVSAPATNVVGFLHGDTVLPRTAVDRYSVVSLEALNRPVSLNSKSRIENRK
jgi:hypothetical protein